MEEPPPKFPHGVPAVVTSDGIAYKWSSSEGDGEMWPPSVGVTWTEKGLTFKLNQNEWFGETTLAVRPEGTYEGSYDTATFTWSRIDVATWLEVPEAVRESVKRAFSAITTRHERDSRERERIQREREAALAAQEAAARKRILGQLED